MISYLAVCFFISFSKTLYIFSYSFSNHTFQNTLEKKNFQLAHLIILFDIHLLIVCFIWLVLYIQMYSYKFINTLEENADKKCTHNRFNKNRYACILLIERGKTHFEIQMCTDSIMWTCQGLGMSFVPSCYNILHSYFV